MERAFSFVFDLVGRSDSIVIYPGMLFTTHDFKTAFTYLRRPFSSDWQLVLLASVLLVGFQSVEGTTAY